MAKISSNVATPKNGRLSRKALIIEEERDALEKLPLAKNALSGIGDT